MAQDLVTTGMNKMESEFSKTLPAHIESDKFCRTAITTIKTNKMLADIFATEQGRKSIYGSLLKAAQDGLIPDGREAALVPFKNKGVMEAQYMPMVWGLIRKARNSDQIATFNAPQIVYEKDEFIYEVGDNERLEHRPNMFSDRGEMVGAYAIAKLTNGEIVRAVMTKAEILKRKGVSKAGDSQYGPWKNWQEEMWKKTVMRQLCKYLPSSVDVDAAFARDDTMVDITPRASDESPIQAEGRPAKDDYEDENIKLYQVYDQNGEANSPMLNLAEASKMYFEYQSECIGDEEVTALDEHNADLLADFDDDQIVAGQT